MVKIELKKMSKFKIEDKIKVIHDSNPNGFLDNDIVKIISLDDWFCRKYIFQSFKKEIMIKCERLSDGFIENLCTGENHRCADKIKLIK